MLESDRIALIEIDLPPLGVARLALQLRQLSVCDFSPGVVASAARLLSHYVYAGALLGSVARLDRVPVSLKSHARSWMPGSTFAVLAHPEPQLLKLTSSGAAHRSHGSNRQDPYGGRGVGPDGMPVLAGPQFATTLLVARGALDQEWVTGALATAWRVSALQEWSLPTGSADWWGTQKLVEFSAAIADITALYQLVASVRREECRWCGLELIGDRCGFCSAPVAPPEPQTRQRGIGRRARSMGALNPGAP
jgi:hypothetical protein